LEIKYISDGKFLPLGHFTAGKNGGFTSLTDDELQIQFKEIGLYVPPTRFLSYSM
jgi:hypothetical protein